MADMAQPRQAVVLLQAKIGTGLNGAIEAVAERAQLAEHEATVTKNAVEILGVAGAFGAAEGSVAQPEQGETFARGQ